VVLVDVRDHRRAHVADREGGVPRRADACLEHRPVRPAPVRHVERHRGRELEERRGGGRLDVPRPLQERQQLVVA